MQRLRGLPDFLRARNPHRIDALLGLNGADTLRYADRQRGQRRAVRLVRSSEATSLEAFVLAGDTRAEAWMATLLREELPAQA